MKSNGHAIDKSKKKNSSCFCCIAKPKVPRAIHVPLFLLCSLIEDDCRHGALTLTPQTTVVACLNVLIAARLLLPHLHPRHAVHSCLDPRAEPCPRFHVPAPFLSIPTPTCLFFPFIVRQAPNVRGLGGVELVTECLAEL